MTGYFHVAYRDTLSGRSRWARQSTTRSRSSEQNLFCFITSPRLWSSGRWEVGGPTHLDHSENRRGSLNEKISLVLFWEEASVFYEGRTYMERDGAGWNEREKKSSDKLRTHRLTQHFSGGDSVLLSQMCRQIEEGAFWGETSPHAVAFFCCVCVSAWEMKKKKNNNNKKDISTTPKKKKKKEKTRTHTWWACDGEM